MTVKQRFNTFFQLIPLQLAQIKDAPCVMSSDMRAEYLSDVVRRPEGRQALRLCGGQQAQPCWWTNKIVRRLTKY